MKRVAVIRLLIFFAVVCALLSAALAYREQRELSGKLIRLHVVGNSDSAFDQRVKLQVRDAILAEIGEAGWSGREEAERCLIQMLPELKAAADAELKRCGSDLSANVQLNTETYPTRVYPTFSLPAGEYLSLRVTIGNGEGKNWWCVVYPSICGAAVSDLTATAAAAGFSKSEVRLITADDLDVKLRFKLLEWMQSCRIF